MPVIQRIFYVFTFVLASVTIVISQDYFEGIVPAVTTRAEVESKFGRPNDYGRYEFDESRVDIVYREAAAANENDTCFSQIPVGSVLFVEIELYYDLYIQALELDPKLWSSGEVAGHVPNIQAYSNSSTGITYTVQDGKVTHITYRVSDQICDRLKRKKP